MCFIGIVLDSTNVLNEELRGAAVEDSIRILRKPKLTRVSLMIPHGL